MSDEQGSVYAFGYARRATFQAAVNYLSTADPAEASAVLHQNTQMYDVYKDDPRGLGEYLREKMSDPNATTLFGAWKAAQQVLLAAGIPEPEAGEKKPRT